VVEHGPVEAIFGDPQHPYTRALLGTVPSVTGPRERRLRTIEGQPPVLMADPDFCPFAARCPHVFDRCRREDPPRIPVGAGHDVACWWDPATGGPRHGV
jgi:peptide/nickel transport system ATP-binding protein/oligopeptide transport system ATP-binding protein